MAIPESVREFRRRYRAESISPRYSGVVHFAFTTVVSLAAIVAALLALRDPTWQEALTVPVTFLYANFVEYFGHRGPMHHRRRSLSIVHRRHTLEHHQFYTSGAMAAESSRDFKMVLFPAPLIVFFIGGFAGPVGAALYLLVSPNVGLFFLATGVAYFLNYEWFHLAYHQPWIHRVPGLRLFAQHHTLHHDPAMMTRANFNITYPVCDLLFRTFRRTS